MSKTKQPKDAVDNNSDNKVAQLQQQVADLTSDLQRTRADFENYRKRIEQEKITAKENGESAAIIKLLPIIDAINNALNHMPEELAENAWAKGVASVAKNLEKLMAEINLEVINAQPGTEFDPELHYAVQVDEDSEGDIEVVAEELQRGHLRNKSPLRHAMVKVKRQ